jgi:hypothetical protein
MLKWILGGWEGLYGPKTGKSLREILELETREDITHRKAEHYEEEELYAMHMQENFFNVQGVDQFMGEKLLGPHKGRVRENCTRQELYPVVCVRNITWRESWEHWHRKIPGKWRELG